MRLASLGRGLGWPLNCKLRGLTAGFRSVGLGFRVSCLVLTGFGLRAVGSKAPWCWSGSGRPAGFVQPCERFYAGIALDQCHRISHGPDAGSRFFEAVQGSCLAVFKTISGSLL